MSEYKPPENGSPQTLPELPRLSSTRTHWIGITLEHHHQPPFETPEYTIGYNFIGINVGSGFHLQQKIDGRWRSGYVFPGAIGLCPFNLSYALRWDNEMSIISLNLEHKLLIRNALELLETEQVELMWQIAFQDPLIQQIGLALKAELQSNEMGSQLYAETMANALAVHLLRHYLTQGSQTVSCNGGLPHHKLRLVIDYVNDYLERELSLNELATIAQLSQYHFCHAFKQATGLSPHQYLIQQRVERAKQLLKQGEMTIGAVAIACGFTHQSHLNRHFKRLTGATPKIWRNS